MIITSNIMAAIYIFFRLSALTLVAPIFPFAFTPVLVRLAITVVFSVVIAASLDVQSLAQIPKKIEIVLLISEFFLGVILSLGFHAANAAIHMMGQLIDIQTGMAVASTFDPANYQPNSPIGTLFSLILIISFFSVGLHYDVLFSFGELFRAAPPGIDFGINAAFFHSIAEIFMFGFIVASPIIIILWIVDISLSLMSRSLPQAQIYFVAMPLKIMLSFVLLGMTLANSNNTIYILLKNSLSIWTSVIR